MLKQSPARITLPVAGLPRNSPRCVPCREPADPDRIPLGDEILDGEAHVREASTELRHDVLEPGQGVRPTTITMGVLGDAQGIERREIAIATDRLVEAAYQGLVLFERCGHAGSPLQFSPTPALCRRRTALFQQRMGSLSIPMKRYTLTGDRCNADHLPLVSHGPLLTRLGVVTATTYRELWADTNRGHTYSYGHPMPFRPAISRWLSRIQHALCVMPIQHLQRSTTCHAPLTESMMCAHATRATPRVVL
jgi:hypothetical protein